MDLVFTVLVLKKFTYFVNIYPVFLYVSTPVISNYWYLNINFQGPENLQLKSYPVGIWCQNDVTLTSMRRHHVASMLIRRHFTSHRR